MLTTLLTSEYSHVYVMCFDGTHEFTFRMTYRHTHNVLTIAYQRISPKKKWHGQCSQKTSKMGDLAMLLGDTEDL